MRLIIRFMNQIMCKEYFRYFTTSMTKWLPVNQGLGLKNICYLLRNYFKRILR